MEAGDVSGWDPDAAGGGAWVVDLDEDEGCGPGSRDEPFEVIFVRALIELEQNLAAVQFKLDVLAGFDPATFPAEDPVE